MLAAGFTALESAMEFIADATDSFGLIIGICLAIGTVGGIVGIFRH